MTGSGTWMGPATEYGTHWLMMVCLGMDPSDSKRLQFAELADGDYEAGESASLDREGWVGGHGWSRDSLRSYKKGRKGSWGRFRGTPQVGVVYRVRAEMKEGLTVWPHTAEWIGYWPNSEDRQTWSALATGLEREAEGWKGRDAKDAWKEALDPLREAYQRARGPQRVQMLARFVAYITG